MEGRHRASAGPVHQALRQSNAILVLYKDISSGTERAVPVELDARRLHKRRLLAALAPARSSSAATAFETNLVLISEIHIPGLKSSPMRSPVCFDSDGLSLDTFDSGGSYKMESQPLTELPSPGARIDFNLFIVLFFIHCGMQMSSCQASVLNFQLKLWLTRRASSSTLSCERLRILVHSIISISKVHPPANLLTMR